MTGDSVEFVAVMMRSTAMNRKIDKLSKFAGIKTYEKLLGICIF
jgi:hypothetical protein